MAEDSLISKNTKQTVTFASALFFSFNILFFAPLEIYLGNMNDISVPLKYVLWGIAPLTVAVTAILFFLLYKTKEKYFHGGKHSLGTGTGILHTGKFPADKFRSA